MRLAGFRSSRRLLERTASCRSSARSRAGGFTLIEVVLAMALLATIMVLLYSGLTFAIRSWDAGDANGRRVADQRLGANFLRRELSEMFPLRWKDATVVRFAFEGEEDHVKFASSRPPGIQQAGLALVALELQAVEGSRGKNLVMRRALPDDEATDFSPLEKAEPSILLTNVASVEFAYFGSESEFVEPKWTESWSFGAAIPQLVRMRVKTMDGRVLPDFVMRVMLGPEAGCLESWFQRNCRPRRPA
jgi:general secretion pathway protein J